MRRFRHFEEGRLMIHEIRCCLAFPGECPESMGSLRVYGERGVVSRPES